MQHTIKIQGRGIGKIKEAVDIALTLMRENCAKNKFHIIAEKKNHNGYISLFKKQGVEVEIVEQTENYVVLKCKK